jgi:hypothetical protein
MRVIAALKDFAQLNRLRQVFLPLYLMVTLRQHHF